MRIAFILQTHKCLGQIERLIATMQTTATQHVIVVIHDGPPAEVERLANVAGVTRAMAAVGGRGTFGLVEGLLASLRWLRDDRVDYDWLVMMSGQDYLVRPLADLEEKLATSIFDGHYHHFRAHDPADAMSGAMQWPLRESEDRYYYAYRSLRRNLGRLGQVLLKPAKDMINRTSTLRLTTSYGLMLGRRASQTPFSRHFELIGGSYWMVIRRSCAEYLLDDIARNPDIEEHYRRTLVPEESFIHSILYNSRQFDISNDELRFYDFSNSKHGRPKLIRADDIPRLTRSGYYIARKFDIETDPDILDKVDHAVQRSTLQKASA